MFVPYFFCYLSISGNESLDGIHPQCIKGVNHAKKNTIGWPCTFFWHYLVLLMSTEHLPKEFKKSKILTIITLLNPGKPADHPQSYRRVALLCYVTPRYTYKLLERHRLNRINNTVTYHQQAGFTSDCSCCD